MHVIVWRFQVKPGCEAEFERVYGSGGTWAQLFRRDEAFLGTELLRDAERPGYYVTVDRWTSPAAYAAFRESHAEEYDRVDRECEQLTVLEKGVGVYTQPEHS
ncbi:MAG TPA: antibiotic biosynthesis monooxygenase [Blastocatellia bacterium]|nr:antibiotic biosynthesis monooxygenase [Blastocatellia bacterium]